MYNYIKYNGGNKMIELETVTRKWGNSIGITLPKEAVEKNKLKENEKIQVLICRQKPILKETFGMFKGKWKKSGQQIKNEIRKELHNV
jgi:hypothetical protein